MTDFRTKHSLTHRMQEADRVLQKYPGRIPVIVEKMTGSDVPDIDKVKYLVPADLSISQFLYTIRKRIKLAPDQAMFIFVNGSVPPAGSLMSQIYEENKDKDGFLYCHYTGEAVFG